MTEITYKSASETLNLVGDFTIKDVRKNYLLLALKHHPDKNNDPDTAVLFKNVKDSYDYLICYYDKLDNYERDFIEEEEREREERQREERQREEREKKGQGETHDSSYIDLINQFISITSDYTNNIEITILLECFTNNCSNFSLKLLENIGKDNLLTLYEYISKYADIFNISKETLSHINELIRDKFKNDTIILLNPTLKNILNNDIYKLDYNGSTLYVPLSQRDSYFDFSGGILNVKCIANVLDLSNSNIVIDNANNIHVKVFETITSIFDKKTIAINIDALRFEIATNQLYIRPYQTYILKNRGIAKMNESLDVIGRKDIVVHLYIS